MAGKNTREQAVKRYIKPFQTAMGCIAHGSLFQARDRHYVVGKVNALLLNDFDPFKIRSSPDIYLLAGQEFRVVADDGVPEGPYRVHTVQYFYEIRDANQRQILLFHWEPEATAQGRRTYPHMHVCSALFTQPPSIFPTQFSKLHIPTGRVSFESIILFAIEELGASPRRGNYKKILRSEHRLFDEFRRKP